MKSLAVIVFVSLVVGAGLGAAVATMETRLPMEPPEATDDRPDEEVNQPTSGPKAEVPELVFNFDRIERGASMSHAFLLRNVGDQPLRVEVGSTTCKCTVGDLAENEIPPGDQTEVVLEWVAKTAPGPFRHGATLITNDPTQSRIQLSVEGEVVESQSLVPSELIFGTVRAGESKSASLYLMSNIQDNVEVTDHSFGDDQLAKQLEVEVTPVEPSELPDPDARSGVQLTVTFQAGKTVGPFMDWLSLETNLESSKTLSVPVAGSVVGDISIFGPGWIAPQGVLRLGSVPSEEGKQVRLNLAVRGEHAQDTKLSIGSIDTPALQVELGEARQMSDQMVHYPLIVSVPPDTRPMMRMTRPGETQGESPSGDAEVVIETTHPDTSEVRLYVRFSVEK